MRGIIRSPQSVHFPARVWHPITSSGIGKMPGIAAPEDEAHTRMRLPAVAFRAAERTLLCGAIGRAANHAGRMQPRVRFICAGVGI
jgi:hypothetical protein